MLGLLALVALLPLYLPHIAAGQSDALYRTLLGGSIDTSALAFDLWSWLALAGLLIVAAWWWPTRWGLQGWTPSVRAGVAGIVTTLVCAWVVLPWWADRLQQPVKTAALQARAWADGTGPGRAGESPSGGPTRQRVVVQWRLHQPSFALYLGRPTEVRPPRQGELALVRLDRLPAAAPAKVATAAPIDAPAATLERWRMLYQSRGYGLLLWLAAEQAPDTP
jgi:hypothetical protein